MKKETETLKRSSIIFGVISLIYTIVYFINYDITEFIQITIGLGMFWGAFISCLTLFYLEKRTLNNRKR